MHLVSFVFVLSGIEEEGLLLEDTVQTSAIENPPPEELPAELPPPELPEGITLPEPPVEIEASGSGTGDLDDLLPPSTSTAAEEETSLEETPTEDVLITEDVGIDAGDISEEETEEVEVAAVGPAAEDVAAPEEEHLNEVVVDEAEISEELEVSTISTETTEEEGLPAVLPAPDAVDVESEVSEPEAAETTLLPVSEDSVELAEDSNLTDVPPADEEVNTEQPEEVMVLSYPEEPVFEKGGMEAPTESEGQEVKEETAAEAPAVVEEGPEAPEISSEDLTEDEILLVDKDEPEPSVTESLSPAQPTALSPEKESPFTRISDIHPASDEQPDIFIPSLVEVKQKNDLMFMLQENITEYAILGFKIEELHLAFPFNA